MATRRADHHALPEILFTEDLAALFGVTESQARQNLSAGVYGPRFRIGKRYGILRTVLLEHLRQLSCLPEDETPSSPASRRTLDLVARPPDRSPSPRSSSRKEQPR